MKRLRTLQRFASTCAFAAIAALASLNAPEAHAQSSETKEKIRLMATALRARESGDLNTAKANLEELLRINPNDANVQRLLDSVNKDIERQTTGQPTIYGQAATVNTFEPSNASVTDSSTVVAMSNGDGTDTLTEIELAGASGDVDYLMASVAAEQQQAIANAQQAMADAKVLIENDRGDEADALLEAAQNQIPESTATEFVIADVKAMRGDIILKAGKEALAANNIPAAEAAAAAYEETLGDDKRLANYRKAIAKVADNPWLQDPEALSPEYVENQEIVEDLLVKARAMMLYGDYSGSMEKLREVEARDPTNRSAKALQMEIIKQLGDSAWLDHEKTRDQMLQEVARSWQRPQVYDFSEPPVESNGANPIREKLKTIFIPRVSFAGVPLSRVVETLSELSVEYDPTLEEDEKGVNMILLSKDGNDPMVSITLRNLDMERILNFVTESVSYSWDVGSDAVLISRGSDDGGIRLETEFFPISRGTIIRLTGSGDGGGSSAPADPFAAPAAVSAGPSASDTEENLRNFFQRAGVDFNEPGSSLAFDGTQLIVTQTPRNLERMRNILRRYDQPKQVEIEAKFLDVIQGNLDELGFNWSVTSASGRNSISSDNISLSEAFSLADQSSNIGIESTNLVEQVVAGQVVQSTVTENTLVPAGAPSIPNAIDLGQLGGVAGSFMGVIQGVDVNLTVNALSRQEGSDLLSAPKLTVLSGRTAQIVVAQELRYPENYGDIEAEVSNNGGSVLGGGGTSVAITAGTPQDFTVRNVGVEMEVTPTVEENENISLKLEPRVTEFEGFVEYGGPSIAISGGTTVTVPSGFFQPIFSTREVRTEVTIFDGATVVIGGLTREEIKTIEDKVPVLGDIPFLGRLFQNKGETAQKRNLLIFVTANLISPGGSPARQTLGDTEANSLFQNPIVVTPGGGVSREISE
ncbi:MAG: type II secretory pathway, component PulD [Verrucomicrobiota bacterium]